MEPANELSLHGSLARILNNGIGADLEFILPTGNKNPNGTDETEVVKAHSFILQLRSTFLYGQINFRKNDQQKSNGTIVIRELEKSELLFASDFKAILHYIYTGTTALINEGNIAVIYHAANIYSMKHLARACLELTRLGDSFEHLDPASSLINEINVRDLMVAANNHNDENLLMYCWSFIDGHVLAVLQEHCEHLTKEELSTMVGRDTLWVNEQDLFEQLIVWAKMQCAKDATKKPSEELSEQSADEEMETSENESNPSSGTFAPSGAEIRAKLDTLLFDIRMPLIPPLYFVYKIVPLGILKPKEIVAMFKYYMDEDPFAEYPAPFKGNHRQSFPRQNKLVDKDEIDTIRANFEEKIRALSDILEHTD